MLLGSLSAAIWVIGLTFYSGRAVSKVLGWNLRDAWSRAAWNFALGVLALQWFWLATGFCRLWRAPVLEWFGILTTVGFAISVFRERRTGGLIREGEWVLEDSKEPSWALPWFRVLACAGVGIGVLVAFLPETFYDSLAYVLAVPDQWLKSGGIVDDPSHLYSGISLGASLWFTTGLAAFGEGSARWMAVCVAPVLAMGVGGWARETAGRTAGWMAAALILTMPQLENNGWAVRSDGLLALLLLLAFDALARRGDGRSGGGSSWRSALLSGLLFGAAFSVKYIALASLPALGVWVWMERGRFRFRDGLGFALGAMAFSGPWLLKNVVFAGNPLYPYFPALFGGRALPDAGYARLLAENHLTKVNWFSWPLVLWRLMESGYGESQASGPMVLAILPILFLFRLRRLGARAWAGSLVVFWLAGLCVTPALRFHMAGFALFALGAAWVWDALPLSGRKLSAALTLAIGLCGIYWMAYLMLERLNPLGVLSLRESRETYAERTTRFPYGPLAAWAGETVPSGGRMLLVGDGRGFGYPCRVLWNSVDDEAYLARSAREDLDDSAMERRFRRDGITHVAFNLGEGAFTAPEYGHYLLETNQWRRLDAHLRSCLTPLRHAGDLYLFAVRAPGETYAGVDPMTLLSPPAIAARIALLDRDVVRQKAALAEMMTWFPDEADAVTLRGDP
jgi:hypothetical protein